MNKTQLRHKYKVLRNQLSVDNIEDLSLEIANKSLELPVWGFTYYHVFLPISEKKEVNTEYLLHILQGKDKSVVIPKTNFEKREMTHILLQENTQLKLSDYNIPEPVNGIEIPIPQIEVVFIPLLAYDEDGYRVGYGKGFYDRFLAKCNPKTVFIGLSLFPPENKITQEAQDIPIHFCVTPEKIYSF